MNLLLSATFHVYGNLDPYGKIIYFREQNPALLYLILPLFISNHQQHSKAISRRNESVNLIENKDSMDRNIGLILFLLLHSMESLKVISSFEDYEKATSANLKGSLNMNSKDQTIEDVSLCLRFLSFFKQKITLGRSHK